jgi:hypothetical protein
LLLSSACANIVPDASPFAFSRDLLDHRIQMPLQHSFTPHGCIALADARFVQWLLGHAGHDEAGGYAEPDFDERQRLAERLAAAAQQAGVQATLGRLYWYTSHPDPATVPGQVVRLVPPDSADGGVGLVLALARDAVRLAQGRACAHVLLASDDDRLLTTVDHLQHLGVQVHLVADQSAADLPELAKTDRSWASLLRLADSRPLLDASARAAGFKRTPAARQALDDGERETIGALVNRWLDSLGAPQRTHFQLNLPRDRGLPQEADRELLLEISHHLGRPLTAHERKVMRETARYALEHTVSTGTGSPESHSLHPVQSRPCEEAASSYSP